MSCGKIHTHEIMIECLNCRRKNTIIRIKQCKVVGTNILEMKRIGCNVCRESILMYLHCMPQSEDTEYSSNMYIHIKNLD